MLDETRPLLGRSARSSRSSTRSSSGSSCTSTWSRTSSATARRRCRHDPVARRRARPLPAPARRDGAESSASTASACPATAARPTSPPSSVRARGDGFPDPPVVGLPNTRAARRSRPTARPAEEGRRDRVRGRLHGDFPHVEAADYLAEWNFNFGIREAGSAGLLPSSCARPRAGANDLAASRPSHLPHPAQLSSSGSHAPRGSGGEAGQDLVGQPAIAPERQLVRRPVRPERAHPRLLAAAHDAAAAASESLSEMSIRRAPR